MAKVFINLRDLEIFEYIFKRKIVEGQEIKNAIFSNVASSTMYRRLRKLIMRKYLVQVGYTENSRIRVAYMMTNKALKSLYPDIFDKLKGIKLKSDSILHDLAVNKVARKFRTFEETLDLRFEQEIVAKNVLDFEPSMSYRFSYRRKPDLVLQMCKGDTIYNKIIIEYESSQKAKSRYVSYFNYINESDINAVLYVCKSRALIKTLKSLEQDCYSLEPNTVFYISEEEFLNSNKIVSFESSKKKKINFKVISDAT